jgi:hypothetical protein
MPVIFPRFVPRFLSKGKCVSFELLRAGHGVMYDGVSSYYGDYTKEDFRRLEERARYVTFVLFNFCASLLRGFGAFREARKGMWIKGASAVETPSEYKRRYSRPVSDTALAADDPDAIETNSDDSRHGLQGLSRALSLWRR